MKISMVINRREVSGFLENLYVYAADPKEIFGSCLAASHPVSTSESFDAASLPALAALASKSDGIKPTAQDSNNSINVNDFYDLGALEIHGEQE